MSPGLTAVNRRVQLLAKGYRNKEVAAALNISEDTVLTHMKSILGAGLAHHGPGTFQVRSISRVRTNHFGRTSEP